jgi:hypothetical protein
LHEQFKFQVATHFFMICRTAAYVLTAVLTLCFKLLPGSSDLLPQDSQLGAERRKQCRGTWCYSPKPLWHSISSCSQDCTIYATSSFSPAASTHLVIVAPDEDAAITVELFDQTLLADMEMLYIKKQYLACGMAGSAAYGLHAPLSRRTGRRTAALHWPLHTQ